MNNIQFLTIEGTDLSGKSTLYKELWSAIEKSKNYTVLLTDRGYFSILCYGKHFNRFSDYSEIEENFLNFLNNNIVFYIRTDEKTILDRYTARGDSERSLNDVLAVRKIYEEYAEKYATHPNFFAFNAEAFDLVNLVVNVFNTISKRTLFEKIEYARITVELFGQEINGTKEVRNYTIFHNTQNVYLPFLQNKEFSELEQLRPELYQLEKASYVYQYARLKKKIETVLSGYGSKYPEDVTSRKFVFTDDECLSYFHILVRNNTLYVKVNFRSQNAAILKFDVDSILQMLYIFKERTSTEDFKINLQIDIDSLHTYLPNGKI